MLGSCAIFSRRKVNINSTSVIEIDKRTVLHYAAEQGNLEIVKFLLQNGANPNAKEFREKAKGFSCYNVTAQ